nr:MAG TPA: hypothetical protein [Caudoviricetes sp.]
MIYIKKPGLNNSKNNLYCINFQKNYQKAQLPQICGN